MQESSCVQHKLLCRHMVWCRENTSAPPHSIWESKHEQKGQSKQTWLLPAATQHSCDHFKWVLMNKFAGLKKKKKGCKGGDRLKITREIISCHHCKVKTVTSFVLLRLSMNHFILRVHTPLLCPSNISYRTCVIAPWQEQFLIPINHSYGDMGFFLTWRLPPSLLSALPAQPPCFTVIVINNRSSVKPLSSEPRFPGLHPIRTGQGTQCIEWYIDHAGLVAGLFLMSGMLGLHLNSPVMWYVEHALHFVEWH